MEPLRKELAEGVFLTYVPAAKFKTGVLGAQLITPLEESTVAAGALLPAVLRRGKNASKATVAKHATVQEYRASTGFECLLGWLYLNGQLDRVHELFDTLWQQFDPNETR